MIIQDINIHCTISSLTQVGLLYILNNYLYIDCIVVVSHTDDGPSSDRNMW